MDSHLEGSNMRNHKATFNRLFSTMPYGLVFFLLIFSANAENTFDQRFSKIVVGSYSSDIAEFEAFVMEAVKLKATHVVISCDDLPWARWQYDTPGDPYPSWLISNVGLLKCAVPEKLRPYIPQDYSQEIMGLLKQRCSVLRKHNLKAAFITFEPQALPEKVYEDYPEWRGPQVDNPSVARVPRFTPCINNPEVLALYRESMALLTKQCPELELITVYSHDSGTGTSWGAGLYPGANGSTLFRKSLEKKYYDYFKALQDGARDSGVTDLEVNLLWAREGSRETARQFDKGMAIHNAEGPDATPYSEQVGMFHIWAYTYLPVLGIPYPVRLLEELEEAYQGEAPRLFLGLQDRYNLNLYRNIYSAFAANPTAGLIERLQLLKRVAAERAGPENADALFQVWLNLYEVQKQRAIIGTIDTFDLGSVQERWLTRPFVPFPEELTVDEKEYFRKFQFQGRSEICALDLNDQQAVYKYSGKGGVHLGSALLSGIANNINSAISNLDSIIGNTTDQKKEEYRLLRTRLQAFHCLVQNNLNAILYQHELDTLKKEYNLKKQFIQSHELVPSHNKEFYTKYRGIMAVARSEIDNVVKLSELIRSTPQPILFMAKTKSQEDIRILGPDVVEQFKKKVKIMISHWEDYERLNLQFRN